MVDLRWAMTQALMDNASVRLEVTDRDGRHRRELLLATHEADSTEINEATWRKLGLASPFSEPIMGDIRPEGAALKAGLQVGDRILAVDGTPVADAASLRKRVRGLPTSGQSQMDWLVMRGDQRLTLRIEPRVLRDGGQAIGRIDAVVGRPPEMVTVQLGGWEGLVSGLRRTQDTAWLTLRMIGRMVTGDASIKNLSGPLSIAEGAGQSARLGLSYFLGFLALISVSLGVLNLLPLPMLDGGHLIYYLFEGVTGRPVPERWLARFQRGGVALLLLITFVALFNDVARLLGSA
jgi:regulator of sigma E protease